jgi:hypothetical protein
MYLNQGLWRGLKLTKIVEIDRFRAWNRTAQRRPAPPAITAGGEHGVPLRLVPLGMALLAEADVPWYGVLDLRDQGSVRVFEAEVRRRI